VAAVFNFDRNWALIGSWMYRKWTKKFRSQATLACEPMNWRSPPVTCHSHLVNLRSKQYSICVRVSQVRLFVLCSLYGEWWSWLTYRLAVVVCDYMHSWSCIYSEFHNTTDYFVYFDLCIASINPQLPHWISSQSDMRSFMFKFTIPLRASITSSSVVSYPTFLLIACFQPAGWMEALARLIAAFYMADELLQFSLFWLALTSVNDPSMSARERSWAMVLNLLPFTGMAEMVAWTSMISPILKHTGSIGSNLLASL